jgi:type I restriction enzyme S subunit
MEVRPGYKLTEVGVLPEQWDCERIGDAAANSANAIVGGPFGSDLVSADYAVAGVPVIRGQNMSASLVSGDFVFVSPRKAKSLSANLAYPGDLVFTQRGTLGQVSIVPDNRFECYLISQSQMKVSLKRTRHDPSFVHQYFASRAGQKQITASAIQTGVPHTNLGILRAYRFPAPAPPEQRAIAAALSDVDALLDGLDRLIAKKRDLKQAVMQQLLTGQTRLPGFHGEWEVKRLGELLSYEQPTKYLVKSSEYSDANDIPVLTAGKTFILGYTDEDDGVFSNLPVIIFDDFTTATKYVTFPFKAKSSAMKLLKPRNASVNLRLVYEMMQLIEFKLSEHKRYWISEYQKMELKIPDEKEQTAIVNVLSDMNAELSALEARRDKTRALKQGMMQELLTGKTRLVAPSSNVVSIDPGATPKSASHRQSSSKPHNWQINEAVVVAVLVKRFGSAQYPLGRKRCTKLAYLMHRHVEHQAEGYLKKAAGPYNPAVKYKGPEGIAQKNGYIRSHANGRFSGFVAAPRIAQAESYFNNWYGRDVLDWLEQFRRQTNDELEVLATVDMAIEDLKGANVVVNVEAIKSVIREHPEWQAKLERSAFADQRIAAAIDECQRLFPS